MKPIPIHPKLIDGWSEPEYVASGSTCDVYRVTKDGKKAALKVMFCGREDWRCRRALREAENHRRCEGLGNIVPYLGHERVDTPQGTYVCILMEWMFTLQERYTTGPMKVSDVLRLAVHMVKAMSRLKELGLAHLDIQPKNVYLGADNVWRLGDLGCSGALTELESLRDLRGTPSYMAPEVYADRRYSEKSDVCALTVMVYSLLNGGILPFGREMDKAMAVRRRLEGHPLPVLPGLDPRLAAALARGSAPDPGSRPDLDTLMGLLAEALMDMDPARDRLVNGNCLPRQAPPPPMGRQAPAPAPQKPGLLGGLFGRKKAPAPQPSRPAPVFQAPAQAKPQIFTPDVTVPPVFASDDFATTVALCGPGSTAPMEAPSADFGCAPPPPMPGCAPPPAPPVFARDAFDCASVPLAAPSAFDCATGAMEPPQPSFAPPPPTYGYAPPPPPMPNWAPPPAPMAGPGTTVPPQPCGYPPAPQPYNPPQPYGYPPQPQYGYPPQPQYGYPPQPYGYPPQPQYGYAPQYAPPPRMDQVRFSALAPRSVEPDDYFLVQLFMYQEQFRHVVEEALAQAQTELQEKSSGFQQVRENARVKIVLTSPDVAIEDDTNVQTWTGGYLSFDFAIFLPADYAKKQILLKATVYFDDVPATKLMLTVKVQAQAQPELEVKRQDILSAFVSYASQDRIRVASLIQGMSKARPDLDIFFDVSSLTSGQKWEQQLYTEIDSRDILFLCWSQNARSSPWVEREWRYALRTKGVDAIEPIPLEQPDQCPPPEELSAKHFNDTLLYIINR